MTATANVPPEAIASGVQAALKRNGPPADAMDRCLLEEDVKLVLEAAAPAIAAAERERIRAALADALSGLEDMFPYVPEYFREKWEHQGYIDRAKATLADLSAIAPCDYYESNHQHCTEGAPHQVQIDGVQLRLCDRHILLNPASRDR